MLSLLDKPNGKNLKSPGKFCPLIHRIDFGVGSNAYISKSNFLRISHSKDKSSPTPKEYIIGFTPPPFVLLNKYSVATPNPPYSFPKILIGVFTCFFKYISFCSRHFNRYVIFLRIYFLHLNFPQKSIYYTIHKTSYCKHIKISFIYR